MSIVFPFGVSIGASSSGGRTDAFVLDFTITVTYVVTAIGAPFQKYGKVPLGELFVDDRRRGAVCGIAGLCANWRSQYP